MAIISMNHPIPLDQAQQTSFFSFYLARCFRSISACNCFFDVELELAAIGADAQVWAKTVAYV